MPADVPEFPKSMIDLAPLTSRRVFEDLDAHRMLISPPGAAAPGPGIPGKRVVSAYAFGLVGSRSISFTATFRPEDAPTIQHFIQDIWTDVVALDRWEGEGGPSYHVQ